MKRVEQCYLRPYKRVSSSEISNQNFRANYMNMFLLWAKPISDPAEYGLNVTIHKHDRIHSQKDTSERK